MRRPPVCPKNLRNVEFSAEKKNNQNKKRNRWRLHRPRGQERSLVKREMALAEVRRHEAAKRLSPFRKQVLRKIFTARLPTASRRNKASWGQCYSRHGRTLPNVSEKLMSNIFTSRHF